MNYKEIYLRVCARKLEILFEKNVDIALLKECKNVHEYNADVISHNDDLIKPLEWWTRGILTQEEFTLLKEG